MGEPRGAVSPVSPCLEHRCTAACRGFVSPSHSSHISAPVSLSGLMVGWQSRGPEVCHSALKAFLRRHPASPGPGHCPRPIDSPGRNQHLQGNDHRGALKVSLGNFRCWESDSQALFHPQAQNRRLGEAQPTSKVLFILKTEYPCRCARTPCAVVYV